MRTRRGIIVATAVMALWSLALPAHAGDGGVNVISGIGALGGGSVTAADCMSGGGMVVNGACQGGTANGQPVADSGSGGAGGSAG